MNDAKKFHITILDKIRKDTPNNWSWSKRIDKLIVQWTTFSDQQNECFNYSARNPKYVIENKNNLNISKSLIYFTRAMLKRNYVRNNKII